MCLAYRYQTIALRMSGVQSILLALYGFESFVNSDIPISDQDGISAGIILIACFSISNYNFKHLAACYFIILIYIEARTYSWIGNFQRYLRFNLYIAICIIMIYIFSRSQHI